MNDDERSAEADEVLLRRVQAADPARRLQPADSWMPGLTDAAMRATLVNSETRPRRWAPVMAAAASVILLGVAYAYVSASEPAGTPVPTVTTLALPASSGTSINSCLPFDVQYLRDMPVALSGIATDIGDDGVTLDVDHWYAGGSADVVRLANYDANTVSLDGFSFEAGNRYLITATGGTVNFCGFSGPWNQDLADAFDRAFGP